MDSKILKLSLHRFRNLAGVSFEAQGEGFNVPTIYFDAQLARELGGTLLSVADDIENVEFTKSGFGTTELPRPRKITLRVKGRPQESLAEAKRRGLDADIVGGFKEETSLTVPAEQRDKVAAWFVEHPARSAPFPVGTLLFYNEPS